jgi:hypothetical protein
MSGGVTTHAQDQKVPFFRRTAVRAEDHVVALCLSVEQGPTAALADQIAIGRTRSLRGRFIGRPICRGVPARLAHGGGDWHPSAFALQAPAPDQSRARGEMLGSNGIYDRAHGTDS